MKAKWDSIIMGVIGMGLLCAFLIGLAISIGSVPFGVIVVFVLALALYEFYESGLRPLRRSSSDD